MLTYLFNSRVIDSNNHSEIPTARDDGYIDMVPVKWSELKKSYSYLLYTGEFNIKDNFLNDMN